MKLSTLKLSLIPLFLLSRQAFAQSGIEASSVGDVRRPLTERELDLLDQKGLLPIPDQEIEETMPVEPLRSFEMRHANGFRQAANELGQITESGEILSRYEHPNKIDLLNLRWDLGLSDEYSALATTGLRQERQWGNHRPLFEVQALGRAFNGDGASLDEIYQGAYRTGQDFVEYTAPDSSRTEGSLRLGDTIRLGTMSRLALSAEARQDHYEIKDALEDGSSYQALSLYSSAAFSKDLSLETTLRRSLIAYRDERNDFEQSQAVNEAESLLVSRVSPYYSAGLGFRTLDGTRNGPVITLIRRPDERSEGEAKLSYLKGEGSDQTLGSLRAKHKFTRLLSVTLNLQQNIDLLSAYSSQSVSGRSNVRQQRITKSYEMLWAYEGKSSQSSLQLLSNRQDYEASFLTQDEVRFILETNLNPLDTLIVLTSLRHYTEQGEVFRAVDRRQSLVDVSWRHDWGMDTRLFGARFFGELGLAHERLWEGSRERARETFRIALGQEWK